MNSAEFNTLISKKKIKPYILAGGSGWKLLKHSQLYPLMPENKYSYSKSACLLANRRIIDFQIEAVKRAGIKDVWINIHSFPSTIKEYGGMDIHKKDQMAITFVEEDKLYGTAGSLKNLAIASQLKDDDIVLLQNGDLVHNMDLKPLIEAHLKIKEKENRSGVTITVNPIENWDMMKLYGSVRLEGMTERSKCDSSAEFEGSIDAWYRGKTANKENYYKIESFKEKLSRNECLSNLNDSSIYVFDGKVINDFIPLITPIPLIGEKEVEGAYFCDICRHVFDWITKTKDHFFYAYIMPEHQNGVKTYWLDIGTRSKLWEANMAALDGKLDVGLNESEFWTRMTWGWRGRDVNIDSKAKIENSIISDNVIVGPNVTIEHSVIGAGTIIKEWANIKNCITFPRAKLDEPNIIGVADYLENIIFLGGKIDDGYRKIGKGGEILYNPVGGVIELPLEDDAKISIDEKRRFVVEKLSGIKELAQMCLGSMPIKHLDIASPDCLVGQINTIDALFKEYNSRYGTVCREGTSCANHAVVDVMNSDSCGLSIVMVASNDSPGISGHYSIYLARKFRLNDKVMPLKIKTEWSVAKDNKIVTVFDVTDENGKKLPDELLGDLKEQLRGIFG